ANHRSVQTHVWNLLDGSCEQFQTKPGSRSNGAFACNAHGDQIIDYLPGVGMSDDLIRVWELDAPERGRSLEFDQRSVPLEAAGWEAVTSRSLAGIDVVAYHPDGNHAIGGFRSGALYAWDLADGKLEHILTVHTGSVTSVAYDAGGSHVVSGSMDKT